MPCKKCAIKSKIQILPIMPYEKCALNFKKRHFDKKKETGEKMVIFKSLL